MEEPGGVADDIDWVICYQRLVNRNHKIAGAEHINLAASSSSASRSRAPGRSA